MIIFPQQQLVIRLLFYLLREDMLQNEDRKLWKLGTLPPGLITFYNLTYPLNRTWHVLGLGYDPAVDLTEIENAAVVHYNGNYKPWLDLAISKYRPYWSKYVDLDNSHVQDCYTSKQ
jgi:alpha-1,4-galacturonosyltransferase